MFENPHIAKDARIKLNLLPLTKDNNKYYLRICEFDREISKDSNNLFITNLSSSLTPRQFYEIFLECGDIKSAKMEVNENGLSKGFGFVTYYEKTSVNKAIELLNKKVISGSKIEIIDTSSKDDSKSLIYIKHLPTNYDEKSIRDFLSLYGEVISVKMYTLNNTFSGACIVGFADIRSAAVKDISSKSICFTGNTPVYANFYQKKNERSNNLEMKNLMNYKNKFISLNNESIKLIAFAKKDLKFDDVEKFEKELKIFMNVVMLSNFTPISVICNFTQLNAIVTVKNYKDANLFITNLKKLSDPEFLFEFYNDESIVTNIDEKISKNYIPNPKFFKEQMKIPHQDYIKKDKVNENQIPQQIFSERLIPNNTFKDNKMNFPQPRDLQNFKNNFNFMEVHHKENNFVPDSITPNCLPQGYNSQPNFINNNERYYENKYNYNPNIRNFGGMVNPQILPPQNNIIPNQINGRGFIPNINNPPLINLVSPNKNINYNPPQIQNIHSQIPYQVNSFNNIPGNQFIGQTSHYPNVNYMPIPINQMNHIVNQNHNNFNPNNQINNFNQFHNHELNNNENEVFINESGKTDNLLTNFNLERLNELNFDEMSQEVYEISYGMYPNEATKITGMIRELGENEMRRLLLDHLDLKNLINQAFYMINE